jgi:hypothetical protein
VKEVKKSRHRHRERAVGRFLPGVPCTPSSVRTLSRGREGSRSRRRRGRQWTKGTRATRGRRARRTCREAVERRFLRGIESSWRRERDEERRIPKEEGGREEGTGRMAGRKKGETRNRA